MTAAQLLRTRTASDPHTVLDTIPAGIPTAIAGTESEVLVRESPHDPRKLLSSRPVPVTHSERFSRTVRDYFDTMLECTTLPYAELPEVERDVRSQLALIAWSLAQEEAGRILSVTSFPAGRVPEGGIPLAYGADPLPSSQEKHHYRKGLDATIQLRCAIHLNCSLSPQFFEHVARRAGVDIQAAEHRAGFEDDIYMSIAREHERNAWAFVYLFGSSVSLDASVLDRNKGGSRNLPFACSLKHAPGLAYRNRRNLGLSLNDARAYFDRITELVDSGVIPAPSAVYSRIRPKGANGHVDYLESRIFELQGLEPSLLPRHLLQLYKTFFVHTALRPSPLLSSEETRELEDNIARVARLGRHPECRIFHKLRPVLVSEAGSDFARGLLPTAAALDAHEGGSFYTDAVRWAVSAFKDPRETVSGQMQEIFSVLRSHVKLGEHLFRTIAPRLRPEEQESSALEGTIQQAAHSIHLHMEQLNAEGLLTPRQRNKWEGGLSRLARFQEGQFFGDSSRTAFRMKHSGR